MNLRVDWHIHTTLSPCGDLSMSPDVIIASAKSSQLDVIGITDHNSTRQCAVIRQMAARNGLFVLQGAEVTTREEVHCLAFFRSDELLYAFQEYLDTHLPLHPNNPEKFGYQVAVDEHNNIVYTEDRLLIHALNQSIDQVEVMVHQLEGLFIPAHMDKSRFSIMSQLGFMPPDLKADAIEISPFCSVEKLLMNHPELAHFAIIGGSDAHYPGEIGRQTTLLNAERADFESIQAALLTKRNEIQIFNK